MTHVRPPGESTVRLCSTANSFTAFFTPGHLQRHSPHENPSTIFHYPVNLSEAARPPPPSPPQNPDPPPPPPPPNWTRPAQTPPGPRGPGAAVRPGGFGPRRVHLVRGGGRDGSGY